MYKAYRISVTEHIPQSICGQNHEERFMFGHLEGTYVRFWTDDVVILKCKVTERSGSRQYTVHSPYTEISNESAGSLYTGSLVRLNKGIRLCYK